MVPKLLDIWFGPRKKTKGSIQVSTHLLQVKSYHPPNLYAPSENDRTLSQLAYLDSNFKGLFITIHLVLWEGTTREADGSSQWKMSRGFVAIRIHWNRGLLSISSQEIDWWEGPWINPDFEVQVFGFFHCFVHPNGIGVQITVPTAIALLNVEPQHSEFDMPKADSQSEGTREPTGESHTYSTVELMVRITLSGGLLFTQLGHINT